MSGKLLSTELAEMAQQIQIEIEISAAAIDTAGKEICDLLRHLHCASSNTIWISICDAIYASSVDTSYEVSISPIIQGHPKSPSPQIRD